MSWSSFTQQGVLAKFRADLRRTIDSGTGLPFTTVASKDHSDCRVCRKPEAVDPCYISSREPGTLDLCTPVEVISAQYALAGSYATR